MPDYVRFLEAGVNVVTVSSWGLIHPPSYEPTWRGQLEDAARRGGASLYASGIEPGFAADQLPLLLMTQSNSIRSIRASEFALYDTYPVEFMMKEVMGFGQPLDHEALLATPGALLSAWGPVIGLIADALQRRGRGDPRAGRPGGDRSHPRGRVRHHRGRHLRGDPHAGHRRGERPGRDRDRARQPHGRGPRARSGRSATATAPTAS